MILSQNDIEAFQLCPARWELRDKYPIAVEEYSSYIKALRKTIFRMYSWQMSNDRLISEASIKDYWDQQWWAKNIKDKSKNSSDVFNKAAEGWLLLEKFYYNVYTRRSLFPIGVNFELKFLVEQIEYAVHFDIVLFNETGSIEYIELGSGKNEWRIYTSLATKLEVASVSNLLQSSISNKMYIDLESRKTDYLVRSINLTEEYISNSCSVIDVVSRAIKNKAIYASYSAECKSCPAAGKCWF